MSLPIMPRWVVLVLVTCVASTLLADASFPLGSFSTTAATDRSCPRGFGCSGFTVDCSGVARSMTGFAAVADATVSPRGVLVFFTGGSGMGWWTGREDVLAFSDGLRALGFTVVQVRWAENWLESSPGDNAGPARLACGPATVIRHVFDTVYVPLSYQAHLGECGFCISGNSGGATQVAFALSHYGLDTILNGVFPSGGPPHSVLRKSCSNDPSAEAYSFPLDTRQFIDRGFGFFGGDGPCARQDPSFVARWDEASVATGGSDYHHPATRIHFIFGDRDQAMQTVGGDYFARLLQANTPMLSLAIASGTPHVVQGTAEGLAAIRNAVLAVPVQQPPQRRRAARP